MIRHPQTHGASVTRRKLMRLGVLRPLPLLVAAALMAGCAGLPSERSSQRITQDIARSQGLIPGIEADGTVSPTPIGSDSRLEPSLFLGSDRSFRLPSPTERITVEGESVALNFVDAPLQEVVEAILGDLLGAPYSIEGRIDGTLTFQTQAPVERQALPDILDSLLRTRGALLVQDGNGMFRIGPPAALANIAPVPRRIDDLAPGQNVVIVPLNYIGATEMAQILAPVAGGDDGSGGVLRADTTRNLLVLGGSRGQLEGWMELIRSFDVDFLAGMSVGVFPLNHASVDEITDALGPLLDGGSDEVAGPLRGLVRVVPIERLNSLLVVSPRAHVIRTLRNWIARLDQPVDNALESSLYVYPVQNGDATHLADVLEKLFREDSASSGASERRSQRAVAPGLSPSGIGEAGATGGAGGTAASGEASVGSPLAASTPSNGNQEENDVVVAQLGPRIRVAADERNNSILIYAPRKDYQRIEAALRRLDVTPTQILIEASIIEVTLTDDLRFGLEWFFNNQLGSRYQGNTGLNFNSSGAIGPRQPGFSFSIANPMDQIRGVLNALAERSQLKVLSNPSLMVLDNHTARIQVGDQQPIRTSETIRDTGLITSGIEFKDTGVLLEVRPSANAGGLITMNVRQVVTDVGQVDQATGQRTFLQREIESRIAVRSGESIVLGGLIRDNATAGRSGVPGLMDVPVLGYAFGQTVEESVRTELLVMLTPRALTNEQQLRAVGDELRGRMRGLRAEFGAFGDRADDAAPTEPLGGALPRVPAGADLAPTGSDTRGFD